MDVSQSNQNQDEVMKVLEKFGFKFFGYNEAKQPLVIAPNGQVTDAKTAYNFLQGQLQTAQTTNAEAGVEAIPQIPTNIDTSKETPVENLETGIEQQKLILDKESAPEELLETGVAKSPKISLPETNESLYSDGHSSFQSVDLDLTKPGNVEALEEFIQKNAKKDNSDPIKWLSFMFQKAVLEQQNKNLNN